MIILGIVILYILVGIHRFKEYKDDTEYLLLVYFNDEEMNEYEIETAEKLIELMMAFGIKTFWTIFALVTIVGWLPFEVNDFIKKFKKKKS